MKNINLFFWQPQKDYLRSLTQNSFGKIIIIVFNYSIWLFLFYISYILIRQNTNTFWQLFVATTLGEIIERYGKSHALWRRPLFMRNDQVPQGMVEKWYKTGSFPSGHTIKAAYFFFFINQYAVFNKTSYLVITGILIFFRVLVGFHYPVDIYAGALIGYLLWLSSHQIVFPEFLTNIIHVIFNFVFLIK